VGIIYEVGFVDWEPAPRPGRGPRLTTQRSGPLMDGFFEPAQTATHLFQGPLTSPTGWAGRFRPFIPPAAPAGTELGGAGNSSLFYGDFRLGMG